MCLSREIVAGGAGGRRALAPGKALSISGIQTVAHLAIGVTGGTGEAGQETEP